MTLPSSQSLTPADATLEKLMDKFEELVIDRSILRTAFHHGEKWVDLWDGKRHAAFPVETTLIATDESARATRTALREYLSERTLTEDEARFVGSCLKFPSTLEDRAPYNSVREKLLRLRSPK